MTPLRWRGNTCASRALAEEVVRIWNAAPALRHLPDPRCTPRSWSKILLYLELWKSQVSNLDTNYTRVKPVTEGAPSSLAMQMIQQRASGYACGTPATKDDAAPRRVSCELTKKEFMDTTIRCASWSRRVSLFHVTYHRGEKKAKLKLIQK